ncbi:molybdenum cofactor guanylyltransferase [Motiliproteus coralliicola]|uniref:Molybdenum cofactor guanylyltransferase n=1 Tax=Motiliproteus coralliicola TaxID=2283196 RepID=A0A369WJF2_9GAMM|nr:molybdenum cofactor guanylyltransferase MobA [Motiliproteus coralliicola]RDE19575.1 molybdenum cofactor guanylyltransferase [Motiliproteus coralliicola]
MSSTLINSNQISALILAGGRAQRMDGCDKGLVSLHGQPMICHVIDTLKPQLELIRINANRNQSAYAALAQDLEETDKVTRGIPGYEVVGDNLQDFQGPLAGIAAGLQQCPTEWMLIAPCDTPFLPANLVERLRQAAEREQAEIVVAHDGKRLQPVVALLQRRLLPSLLGYLEQGERKIDRWYAKHQCRPVDFSDQPEAFLNINTLTEKQLLENQVV